MEYTNFRQKNSIDSCIYKIFCLPLYPISMDKYLLYGFLFYLALMNIIAFFLYGLDKWKSRHAKWRITEARLITFALLGGSLGAFLGMKIWHHKTRHAKFRYGLPLILFLHLAIAIAIVYYCVQTEVFAT